MPVTVGSKYACTDLSSLAYSGEDDRVDKDYIPSLRLFDLLNNVADNRHRLRSSTPELPPHPNHHKQEESGGLPAKRLSLELVSVPCPGEPPAITASSVVNDHELSQCSGGASSKDSLKSFGKSAKSLSLIVPLSGSMVENLTSDECTPAASDSDLLGTLPTLTLLSQVDDSDGLLSDRPLAGSHSPSWGDLSIAHDASPPVPVSNKIISSTTEDHIGAPQNTSCARQDFRSARRRNRSKRKYQNKLVDLH